MRARWQGNCLWAVVLLVLSLGCHAQSVTPDVEYKNLIQVDTAIQPLGKHPFGEQVNLSTGELSFEETDVSLPGNGPLLQLSRTLGTTNALGFGFDAQRPFGDWDLDIPRIETATANQANVTGWDVEATNPLQRCTYFGTPPPIQGQTISSADSWSSDQWWYGYHLIVPGQGSQVVMARNSYSNSLSPTMSGQTFSIVTKQNWMITCGVPADDGGEGFLAIAPDGTKYTFAHLVYRPMTYMTKPGGTGPDEDAVGAASSRSAQPLVISGGTDSLARRDGLMYVTQVQDRFGNTLTYNYDPSTGYLSNIKASDGREIDVTYVSGTPLIYSVTAKATNVLSRTWIYSYDTTTNPVLPTLTGVTLPDGSAWSYSLNAFQTDPINVAFANCNLNDEGTVTATTVTGTVITPTGLTGKFAEMPLLHSRSYVPKSCWGGVNATEQVYFNIPNADYQQSLTSETITGAGLSSTETWNYSYSPANESWTSDACASSGTCATTGTTDVTDPSNNDTVYTFSNRFDATEGQLLRTDYYSGPAASGALVRSVANTYANPTGGPWPAAYGIDQQGRDNTWQTTEEAPLQQRTTTQDSGQAYTWLATAFNAYAQPTDVKRYNNIAGQSSIEETTAYLNDTNLWVLGLPQTVTNVGTGEVESNNTYTSLDELYTRSRFGELLMTYTWYPTGVQQAGQLSSFMDGDNHTTTLSNYYRGIPQSISYPATPDFPNGTSESLVVDDLGEIKSITDQALHTTQYNYDAVGRVSQITYPYDSSIDSAQWYPKVFTYTYVTSAERGLAAGHWRRTITQGSYTDTTYFDAELRPVLDDSSNGSADINTGFNYDWRGLTTFSSYPMSGAPTLQSAWTGVNSIYDALGRLTQSQQDSEQGTLTTKTQYIGGPGTQVTDPKLNVTTTYFQAFDEPVYNAPWSISAPEGVTQSITRDIYGEPTAITQSGTYNGSTLSFTKSLIYDSYHRLCRTVEPETGSTVMSYDAANNLLWSAEGQSISGTACSQSSVAAAAQIVRTYDGMNQVRTIVPPSGTQSTTYTYDALGHVHTAVSGVATQGFAYNSLGDLTGESLQVAGSGFTWALGYGYDAYGHRSTATYPAGTGTSESVSYAPDVWGRPTQAGSYATGVGYYPDGHVSGFTYASGASYAAEENARDLISNFSDGAGSMLTLSEDLAYDPNGNISTVTDLASGLRTKSFQYDSLNRLLTASAANLYGNESYTYDPINNLRTRLTQGQTLTYNYDATNLLRTIMQGTTSNDSFTYNAQGDTTGQTNAAGQNTTLSFDAKHQLTAIPGTESYSYDASGRRVVKQPLGSSPTYYFYSQAGQLMYQYEPGTATATDFIYLGTKLVGDSTTTQLSQPGGIGFGANPTLGGTTVSWGSAPAATSYTLEQSSNSGSSWSMVYSGSATSTTVSGLAGGGYVYRVQACGSGNCSAWTTSATLEIWPTIPTVTVPTGTINGPYTVSWTAAAGATGYTVQESLNGGVWNIVATNITATSISRPGTTTGSYTYQVEANGAYGAAGWSATSAAVSVNTAYGVVPTPAPTLTVPATSSTGSATVSWTAASPVTGYALQQSSNSGGTWTPAYSGTATSAALTGLANGNYIYQVQACNDTAGNSVCTVWATGSTLVVTHPPASAPSLSVPATSSTGSYTVSWGAVSTATSYTLQMSTNGGSTWSTPYTGSATNWAASGQSNGTYAYRVEACNAGGCSAWSGTGSAVVMHPPASAPSLSVPATSTTGSYTVSWGAVSTATSYMLQMSTNGGSSWSIAYSGSATSWVASGQGTGSYTYRVEACNAGGCSAWSGTGTISVSLIPATPTSLQYPSGAYYPGSFTVFWSTETGATSYTLTRTSTASNTVTTVYTGAGTSVTQANVTPGTYQFSLQACNSVGCSAWETPTVKLVVTCNESAVAAKANDMQPDILKCD